MIELIDKYEQKIISLNERLETFIFMGENQKLKIKTEKILYLEVIQDLKSKLSTK